LKKKRVNRTTKIITQKRFASTTPQLASLNASLLQVEKTKKPKPLPPNKDLVFGHEFSDNMLEIDWDYKKRMV